MSCMNTKKDTKTTENTTKSDFASFGKKITAANALSSEAMLEKFNQLTPKDTLEVTFKSFTKRVCQKKGCWMTLDLGQNKEAMVRFKDYGFFVPLDSERKHVIVNGKAYIKTTSVEELRHYAEDAGKSQEQIAKITTPKNTLAFEADGVLIRNTQ